MDAGQATGMTLISDFISKVQTVHATGNATEHSYRSAFEDLFMKLGVMALNEPKRLKCGAPDFILSKDKIVIGYLEAKDLLTPIRTMKGKNKLQQERYTAALLNLIYTNGLDWDFYRDGDLKASVTIAVTSSGAVTPKRDHYERLEHLLHDFIAQRPQTITNPRELAERMAGKASLIKDVLRNTLQEDGDSSTELSSQYQAFKENLIHDINLEDFADIYAETVAYGMFAARLHDAKPDNFSRQKALELLPRSNPFLRNLFSYVAGDNLDDRIIWIIDDLAHIFQACNVATIMEGFGELTGQNDPFLHFYETFLAAYNPAKRKARGVWYTPQPVVNFIVRAVDEVLQTEFGLPDGLADTSKVTIDEDTGKTDNKGRAVTIEKEVHRVQILDPATGTGTFLAEVIKQIAPRIQGVAPGMWSSYIEADLIPRLHGFELLMASYAMCHMKLDMILTERGYRPRIQNPPRLSVYLTNSLEEGESANQTLPFAQWISREAKGANIIKRNMPIMCIIGNPPYSGISHNKGEYIKKLIEDYKYVDGQHFGERKNWLHDDYVKFIRLSEGMIEKNGEGVLGFITNHGYLDNPTFRGMRWHLLNIFDRIHILDLHGNAKKKEVTPEGRPDKNVFDIQQGVAIIIAAKTGTKKKDLAEVYHGDLWGMREDKYEALTTGRIEKLIVEKVECIAPQYAFVRRDHKLAEAYGLGFELAEFLSENSVGIITGKDCVNISFSMSKAKEKLTALRTLSDNQARKLFKLNANDARDWTLPTARADAIACQKSGVWTNLTYRPFDQRCTFYTGNSRGLYASPQKRVMRHMLPMQNLGLIIGRQGQVVGRMQWNLVFVSSGPIDFNVFYRGGGLLLPLYLYPDQQDPDQQDFDQQDFDSTRRVNFDRNLYKRLQELGSHSAYGIPDEVAVFDYIYGVLHCPGYRETYAEFLKIDFPRVPWPANPEEFWDVSAKGNALRKLHLMDSAAIGQAHYPFTGEGDNVVKKYRFKNGRVYINTTQYFDNTSEISWEFYIGGYQPAQKWLKDRKGCVLTFEDVKHYQCILKVLSETDRIMRTISMTL